MPASPTVISDHPAKTPDERQSTTFPPRRCGLTQCRKLECNLRSHRQYAALRRQSVHAKRHDGLKASLTAVHPRTYDDILDQSVSRIECLLADGLILPSLSDERASTFRTLAHHYFTYQIDRLIQVYSPHLDRRKYKSTMMDHALSNGIFCVCITANAKTDMLMRGYSRVADRESELVYATTAYVLRQQLNSFKPTDADWLLVLVVALVGFDLAFDRQQQLKRHHDALGRLISMKGGIATVGHTRPYVLNTDRFLAVFTGEYPICRQTPMLPVTPSAGHVPCPYGKAFETSPCVDILDQPVLDFCLDHCQLIHLMQAAAISLDPSSTVCTNVSAVPYFLYERDRLHCGGTCLYADYHENRNVAVLADKSQHKRQKAMKSAVLGKSRCVLLAVLIIEYTVVQGNYYTVKGPFLADQLKTILHQQPRLEWSEHGDLLGWILFVLAVALEKWHQRSWALGMLQRHLEQKYKKRWPYSRWEEENLAILKEFLWSETFSGAYAGTCAELVKLKTSKQSS